MGKNRYKIEMQPNWQWQLTDTENDIVMTFREGLVNETQKVTTPEYHNEKDVMRVPKLMSEMGDWLMRHHPLLCLCYSGARCTVIELLNKEDYWIVLADALQTAEHICTAIDLSVEVTDYLREDGDILSVDDKQELLAIINNALDDDDATEVGRIIRAYWRYRWDSQPINEWARDVLWWAAFCPAERREKLYDFDVDDDGDIY